MPTMNVSIRRALLDELDENAKEFEVSRSELVEELLEYALDHADLDELFPEEEEEEGEESGSESEEEEA